MIIPFLNLGRLHESIRGELDTAIATVIDESGFIGGDGACFEEEFAEAHGANAAAGCGSGTDALILALEALGVGRGDEVIVPAMTFVATAEAVVRVGAIPVLADVDPLTLLLTADETSRLRTDRTKAVIPVHLYGHMVPASDLHAMRRMELLVVEDAAQAHLARHDEGHAGSVGHCACFSFYPGKNLGAFGDGGAVISTDPDLVAMIRRFRDHGRRTKYTHDLVGHCSRLDGIQAAVLRVKLRHLPRWTEARRAVADRYCSNLGELLVPWELGAAHHLLVANVGLTRDHVAGALGEAGIGTGVHYPVALSDQPALAPWAEACPSAEGAAARILSLPIDPLLTAAEVDEVCETLVPLLE